MTLISPLLAQRRGFPGSRARYREGQALDRPGPEGGTWSCGRAQSPVPPTPAPCRGFRGPLRCTGDFPAGTWRLGSTPPVYPPWYPPALYTHPGTHLHRTIPPRRRHARNSRFKDVVGEPRGVEHRLYSGSQTGYIQLYTVMRLYTAV